MARNETANIHGSKQRLVSLLTRCCWAVCLVTAPASWAGQGTPVVNPPPRSVSVPGLEVEQVEISHKRAVPDAIHRTHGKFILVLNNRTADPNASFVIDPADVGEATVSPTPVLSFDGHAPQVKRRKGGFLDLHPGTYYLKTIPTGHILCTITID